MSKFHKIYNMRHTQNSSFHQYMKPHSDVDGPSGCPFRPDFAAQVLKSRNESSTCNNNIDSENLREMFGQKGCFTKTSSGLGASEYVDLWEDTTNRRPAIRLVATRVRYLWQCSTNIVGRETILSSCLRPTGAGVFD